MWCGRIWLTSLAIFLLLASPAGAATWRVERDGSGDFTAIQPAINAASHGDSILIGPGHYTEYQTVTLPGWSWQVGVYAYVVRNNLTIIGTNPETVVIGPDIQEFHDFGPLGIVVVETVNSLTVENLSIRNLYSGIYFYLGHVSVSECHLLGCALGIIAFADNGVLIDSCNFTNCTDSGIYILHPSSSVVINESYFFGCKQGIGIQNSENVNIANCIMEGDGTWHGGAGGIHFSENAIGSVADCDISNMHNFGIVVKTSSEVHIEGNRISECATSLQASADGVATGTGNLFLAGGFTTLFVTGGDLDLHGNHIINVGGSSVILGSFIYPPNVHIDLTNNYWGTTDTEQIAEWIWDRNDDSSIHAFVDYEPFSGDPLPTEKKSLGEVKALYR